MGEVSERKWERRRNGRKKNKKFSVLEYRIILWVFFFSLYDVADCDWGV
jgi:hypothetical protein